MADNLKIAGLRLVIEGAAQFNSTITQVNNQVKLSSAEFSKLQAQFGKNSKSVELLTGKQKLLQDKLQATKDIGQQYNRILDETVKKYGENSNEAEKVRIAIAKNEAEQVKLEQQLQAVTKQLAVQSSAWTQFGDKCQAAGKKLQTVGDKLSSIGKSLTTKVTAPLVGFGTLASKAAIDFETAFAGVAKTVDATDAELAQISDDIRQMAKEIPATTTEIAAVAEAAGQLGIATEDIMDFTRVMIDLGNSTNLSADEAAIALAKFVNITGMAADDYSRLGSTIVALGNNFTTTEGDIVAMSTRLAASGTLAGMTETDILALAAAMSSVGIEAEAGGTAMAQTMNAIEKAVSTGSDKVEKFAKVAGMSAEEFSAQWKQKPIDALAAFVKGLGELDEKGESATLILDELGLSGMRQSNMLKSLALASGVLTDAIEMSGDAWAENTALANEAAKRYETMASKIQVMKNTLKDVGITLGDALMPYVEKAVQKIKELAESFSNLDEKQQGLIIKIGAVVAAIGPVLTVGGKLTSGLGAIVGTIGKVSTAIGGLAGSTGALAGIFGSVGASGSALAGVFSALAGPIGIVVAAVAALAAAFVGLFQTDEEFRAAVIVGWEEVKSFFSELWTQIADIFSAAFELIKAIFQNALDTLKQFWDNHGEAIKTATSATWEIIKTTIETVLTLISGIIKAITQVIQGDWQGAWETVKNTATTIWNNISSMVSSVFNTISTFIHSKLEEIKSNWHNAWENVKFTIQNVGEAIKTAISNLGSAIRAKFQEIINNARSWGQNLIQGFVQGIRDKIAAVRDAAASVVAAAKDFLGFNSPAKKGEGRHIVEWGANMVGGFIQGMESMEPELAQVAEELAEIAVGGLNEETAKLLGETNKQIKKTAIAISDDFSAVLSSTSKDLKYAAETDYSALMLEAESLKKFLELAAQRNAKIMGENIDLVKAGYRDNAELLSDWADASGQTVEELEKNIAGSMQGLRVSVKEEVSQMVTAFGDMAGAFSNLLNTIGMSGDVAVDYDPAVDYSALMDEAESTEEFLELAAKRNAKIMGENINLVEKGWRDNASIMNTWLTKTTQDISKIRSVLTDALQDVSKYTSDSANKIVDTASKKMVELKDDTDKMKKGMEDSLSTMPSDFQTIGANTIDGLIKGLQSRSSALYETMRSIAQQTVNTMKAELEIKSPSRVFERIGGLVDEGFANGLKDMANKPKIAAINMAQGVVDGVMSMSSMLQPSGMAAAVAGATDSRSYSYGGITVQNMVVRDEMDIKLIAQELYRLQVKNARGRGVVA